MMTTPATVTPEILALCKALDPSQHPVPVPVQVEPQATQDNCFENVDAVVAVRKGRRIEGWLIWEWPGVLLEAVFHAVWEMPNGDRVDVSPKEDGERSILFLPDSVRRYTGTLIESVHRPLSTSPKVREFIAAARSLTALRRRYAPDGLAPPPPEEAAPIQIRLGALMQEIEGEQDKRREADEAKAAVQQGTARSVADYRTAIAQSPADHNLRLELAQALAADGQYQEAMDTCLELVERDRRQYGEPARVLMVNVFKILEADDPALVNEYRRKLTTLLY